MVDLENIKGVNALKLKVGDKVAYRGSWGDAVPELVTITGVGEKNGRVIYDTDGGRWGYADQFDVDPDAGIDQLLTCHNLDKAPLQRLSHRAGSEYDYYVSGNPAGAVRVIHTLEDNRLLVEVIDDQGVPRHYIADTRSYLVLVEDVTRQWKDEQEREDRADPARLLP